MLDGLLKDIDEYGQIVNQVMGGKMSGRYRIVKNEDDIFTVVGWHLNLQDKKDPCIAKGPIDEVSGFFDPQHIVECDKWQEIGVWPDDAEKCLQIAEEVGLHE